MRKVLFATTALVALGGVSAASADISVSAANEFKYSSWSDSYAASSSANKSSAGSTTKYSISASTVTDNGLTMSSYTGQDASGTGAFNDYGFAIGGDFGEIGFAGSESGDAFETDAAVTADEGSSMATTNTVATGSLQMLMPGKSANGGSTVSYKSPAMSGFQFAIGMTEVGNDDGSQMGAQYSMTSGTTSVTLKYAVDNQGTANTSATEIEATSAGVVVGYGDATVTLATNSKKKGSTYDYSSDAIGIVYKVSDALSIAAYTGSTEDAQDSSHEITDTGLGFTYTITPGLSLSVTHNDWDLKDGTTTLNADGQKTTVALDVSF
jgi:hypothetical protein